MPAIKANPSQRLSCGGSLLCSLQRFNIGSFIEQIIYLIAAAGLESVTFLIALNSKFSSKFWLLHSACLSENQTIIPTRSATLVNLLLLGLLQLLVQHCHYCH